MHMFSSIVRDSEPLTLAEKIERQLIHPSRALSSFHQSFGISMLAAANTGYRSATSLALGAPTLLSAMK